MDYENLTPQYRIEEYLEAIVEGWAEATQYSYPDSPSWRIEEFLDAFITYIWEDGDHPRHPCPEPAWRLEECLRAIYDVMTGAATPWPFPLPTTNRIEEYLAAIHAYLVDGTELPVPEPVWRIEQWLAYVLDAVKQGGGVETTVSGSPAHITNALAKAALSVLAHISPIQDLHGYDSPWPAGGGKNLYPILCSEKTYENGGITFRRNANGTITVSGTATTRCDLDVLHFYSGLGTNEFSLPSGTYTISVSGITIDGIQYIAGGASNTSGLEYVDINNATAKTKTININAGTTGYNLLRVDSGTVITSPITIAIQWESDSTATAWTPYSNICPISGRTGLSVYVSPTQDPDDATVYNVDWSTQAGTVYGGTLDVVTGVLTVDRGCVNVSSSWSWNKSDSYPGGFYVDIQNAGTGQKKNTPFICSHAKTATTISQYVQGTCFCDGSINIRIMGGSDTVQNWKDYIDAQSAAGTPIQICYELATPLTYQLTPQEVQMLLGENYVWSSSGDTVSVTYYAEGNANPLQSLNILLGGRYSNPKTADDVSDKEALEIILGGNK